MSERILDIETGDTTPFKTLIEVLKDPLPEVNIKFIFSEDKTKNGLKIIAADTTKTVLINLKLDAKNFSRFICKQKELVIGVRLPYFHKLIKTMDKDDTLTLYVEGDDKNHLGIFIDSPEKKCSTTYKLKLLDLGNKSITIPVITFEALIKMSSTELHKICREMNQIAKHVEIKCLRNKIIFTCKGDYANRESVYKTDDTDIVKIKHGNEQSDKVPPIIQGIFELEKLVLFAKCSSLCNYIEIYMKNNFPLVIKYTVATLGKIHLLLVPTNEDEVKNADYEDEDDLYNDEVIEYLENA